MRNRLLYISAILITGTIIFEACSNEQQLNYQRYFVNGKGLYEKNCQNCHGTNGEGLGHLYPPLTDTLYISKNRSKLACIIKNGIGGNLVDNTSNDKLMPGNENLADIDIAQIITYITNSFGNKQGFYETGQVKKNLDVCN